MKTGAWALFCAILLVGCAPKAEIEKGPPLNPEGHVSIWTTRPNEELKKAAAETTTITFIEDARDHPWLNLLKTETERPDLFLVEWSRDAIKAQGEKSIADLAPFANRLNGAGRTWPALESTFTGGNAYLLPASLYAWGVYCNETSLVSGGLTIPGSWGGFERILKRIQQRGMIPIALGSSSGWPAMAWFSYLDLRLNGLEAHRKLLSGERRFNDPSLKKVYEKLTAWREEGWFDTTSGSKNLSDSLMDVDNGRAAFVLASASVIGRFAKGDDIRWAPLPTKGGRGGEIAVIEGFVLSSTARFPEAALSVADTYVLAGSPDLVRDEFRLPALAGEKDEKVRSKDPYTLASIKTTEADIFRAAPGLVPQMDKYLQPQAAYEANQAFIAFFAVGSRMTAGDLEAALVEIER
jgi:ABC-type glycerol-3-phosphate transport system substrate-binding protein